MAAYVKSPLRYIATDSKSKKTIWFIVIIFMHLLVFHQNYHSLLSPLRLHWAIKQFYFLNIINCKSGKHEHICWGFLFILISWNVYNFFQKHVMAEATHTTRVGWFLIRPCKAQCTDISNQSIIIVSHDCPQRSPHHSRKWYDHAGFRRKMTVT